MIKCVYEEGEDMTLLDASKELSYALRHAPWEYELEMDEEGYVPIEQLLSFLKHPLTIEELYEIVKTDDKGRYDIKDGKICALYGHSFPQKILKQEACPPTVLYHGTAKRFIPSIQQNGLLAMKRQYVHLSTNIKTAIQVGKRKDEQPVLLVIDAKKAYQDGIKFYQGNKITWLCHHLPSQYISYL